MKQSETGLDETSSAAPLLQVLQSQLLPWAIECDEECYTICDPDYGLWPRPREAAAEPLVEESFPPYLTRIPVRSKRVINAAGRGKSKSTRNSQSTATWRGSGIQSTRMPHFACIVQGKTDLQVGNFIFHGCAGDFIFLPLGIPMDDGTRPHLARGSSPDRHCAILWISPSANGLGAWICHSQGERHFTKPEESCYFLQSHLVDLFETMMHEIGAQGAAPGGKTLRDYTIARHLFVALVNALCREIEAGRILQVAHQNMDERQVHGDLYGYRDPIARAQDYIRSHLHEPLSINQVARFCYLSRSRFTRRFREETGSSFAEFLTEERIREAKRLLHETEWSVERICTMVGIHSSRLRAIFRSRGLPSPTSFRRTHVIENNVKSTPLRGAANIKGAPKVRRKVIRSKQN